MFREENDWNDEVDWVYNRHNECEAHCFENGICTESGRICFDNFDDSIGDDRKMLAFNTEDHDISLADIIKDGGYRDFLIDDLTKIT